MRSSLENLRNLFRLSNLVGRGMPERIRSVGFAFLGLTAAAGLALVALFAQMGFPLLSPAPLPDGPGPHSVSRAVRLEQGPASSVIAQARDAAVAASPVGAEGDSGAAQGDRRETRVDSSADLDPGSAPGDTPSSSEPGASVPPAPAPAATEAPVTPTEPTPEPVETPPSPPVSGAKPDKSTAVDSKPDKSTAKPKPEEIGRAHV